TLELADREGAWQTLGSTDRVARYEARLALEAGPAQEIADRLAGERDPWRIIGGSLALARKGGPEHRGTILAALGRLDFAALEPAAKINSLRAVGLVFIRHGEPGAEERDGILARINSAYPDKDE